MKANVSKDCTCRVGDRYRTAREEALESGRRGPENRPGVCAFGNSMLLIMHIILGIMKVTGRSNVDIPSSSLNFEIKVYEHSREFKHLQFEDLN